MGNKVERSQKIIEQDMHGMRKGIPKEETYNYYGDAPRRVEIAALGDHGPFSRVSSKDVPKAEVCINGRFVYTIKRKQSKAGHTRTNAYIDSQRRLDARFAREVIEKLWGGMLQRQHRTIAIVKFKNSPSVISYRKWSSGVMDVSMACLKPNPLASEIYAVPPLFAGENPETRRVAIKAALRIRNRV